MTIDLTREEQDHVAHAVVFLHHRFGSWEVLATALRVKEAALRRLRNGTRAATPTLAYRVARVARVGVDDVLTGKYPFTGPCPTCGRAWPPSDEVNS